MLKQIPEKVCETDSVINIIYNQMTEQQARDSQT